MAHGTLWLNNDMDITLDNLVVAASNTAPTTGATVTAKVKNGASVVSGASSITLSPTSAGSNDFIGQLGSTVTLPSPGTRVTVEYAVTTSSGAVGEFIRECVIKQRKV